MFRLMDVKHPIFPLFSDLLCINTFWKVETASKAAVRWFNAMEFPTFHAVFLFYLPLALNHQQALLWLNLQLLILISGKYALMKDLDSYSRISTTGASQT